VIDYTLSFDNGLGDGSLIVLAQNIIPTSYILRDVVYGKTYTFRVQARSEYEDLSEYSAALSILAAQEPAKPLPIVTTVEGPNEHGEDVIFTWVAPDDMGSPIIAYEVVIRQFDGLTYTEERTYCDASR